MTLIRKIGRQFCYWCGGAGCPKCLWQGTQRP